MAASRAALPTLRRALCGAAPTARNLFALLQVRECFALDSAQLAANYKALQKQWHPDRFHSSPAPQQRQARQISASLNVAYATLREPHLRARHLLQLRTPHSECMLQSAVSPAFLTWTLQFREQIAEVAHDKQKLQQLSAQLSSRTNDCIAALQNAFGDSDLQRAAQHTAELQYYHRIQNDLSHVQHNNLS